MKKILFILLVAFTIQVSAQDQSNWITNNEVALKQAETQNKPILVFVTNNQKTEASEKLKANFFNADTFKKFASKSILLKLDISDKNSTNARLGIHYTKQNGAPGVALIDSNGKTIKEPLVVDFSVKKVKKFLTLWNDTL
ncbi:thioredoxin family protein [Psychroserpens luteolus]|uniref:thioredoxin family protein n=1 Tax=Psychroserpens luteolus TaxID=2855840 RepID=UPI001E44EF61|nr:thioredoxin family protein [Psychroserpens luteolus]MCD2259563.1 thioredoxin family protein [Psychroserpens luteolus]